jgi:tetratricopeptide (TPR) repeat protein
MVREAAYAMLPDADRRAAHVRAGEWLAARGEHDALVLAEHFDRGGATERAAAEYRRAAEQALAANDFAGAIGRARRGAERASGEMLGCLRLIEAVAHRWRGEIAEASACALTSVDLLPVGSADAYHAIEEAGSASGRRGAYDEVTAWAERALASPIAPGAEIARVLCLCTLGRQTFHAGRYDLAQRVLAEVDALVGAREPKGDLVAAERGGREAAGDPAAMVGAPATPPASGMLDPLVAAQVHGLRAAYARHQGDLAGDLAGYQAVLASCQLAGDQRGACNTRVSVGFALAELGAFADAESELRVALADAERMGLSSIATRARQNLGLVLGVRGPLDEAMSLVQRTIEESRAQGNLRFEGWTRIYLTRILLRARDDERAAREGALAAEQLAVSPPARAGALAALAQARIAEGDPAAALAAAREAKDTLDRLGGIEEFEALVRLAYAEALEACGDEDGGREAIVDAREKLVARAERITDGRLRTSFLHQVPENARTLELARTWSRA